jgi:hypothetical protein
VARQDDLIHAEALGCLADRRCDRAVVHRMRADPDASGRGLLRARLVKIGAICSDSNSAVAADFASPVRPSVTPDSMT